MSTEKSQRTEVQSAAGGNDLPLLNSFLPIFLMATGFLVFLGWQFTRTLRERNIIQENITQTKNVIAQAGEPTKRLEKLAGGLLELAKTNSEAQRIVGKYNIQFTPDTKPGAASDRPSR